MPSVHLERVRYSYTSSFDVLQDVDLHLGRGWTGVIGANGTGKTTLLALIAGKLRPTADRVRIDPPSSMHRGASCRERR